MSSSSNTSELNKTILITVQMTGKVLIYDPNSDYKRWIPGVIEQLYPEVDDKYQVLIKHALCCLLNEKPGVVNDTTASFARRKLIYKLRFVPKRAYLSECAAKERSSQSKSVRISINKEILEPNSPSFEAYLNVTFSEYQDTSIPEKRSEDIAVVDLYPGWLGPQLAALEAEKRNELEKKKSRPEQKKP